MRIHKNDSEYRDAIKTSLDTFHSENVGGSLRNCAIGPAANDAL